MIDPNQPENQPADEDFLQSLKQLENILQENSMIEEEVAAAVEEKSSTPVAEPELKIDLAAWEDAVADIEQFLQSRE